MDSDEVHFRHNAEELQKAIDVLGLERIQQIGLSKAIKEFIQNFNSKPKQDSKSIDYEIKVEKLQELKLKNRLTLIRDFNIRPQLALQVNEGTITFEEIIRPKIEKEKSAGLDENGFCSECGHVHFSKAGGRSCTSSLCLCGIRG